MMRSLVALSMTAGLAAAAVLVQQPAVAQRTGVKPNVAGSTKDAGISSKQTAIGHPMFMSPHASPIAFSRGRVFVANTPAATLDVIDARSRSIVARINVGIDPVGVAVRPDGKEGLGLV